MKALRINHQIRVSQVRVVDENEKQLGVMETQAAHRLAQEKGLDLVEVSPKAEPPVCKLMNYGKYRYWQEKQDHKHRVTQRKSELKTIRLSIKISDHDLQVKSHQAQKFLKRGNKVQAEIIFKGREIVHARLGDQVLAKFTELLKEISEVEKEPVKKGRNLFMILKAKQ